MTKLLPYTHAHECEKPEEKLRNVLKKREKTKQERSGNVSLVVTAIWTPRFAGMCTDIPGTVHFTAHKLYNVQKRSVLR